VVCASERLQQQRVSWLEISLASFDPTTSTSSPAQQTAYVDHTHSPILCRCWIPLPVGAIAPKGTIVLDLCGYEPYECQSSRQDEIIDNYIKTLPQILQSLEDPKIMAPVPTISRRSENKRPWSLQHHSWIFHSSAFVSSTETIF